MRHILAVILAAVLVAPASSAQSRSGVGTVEAKGPKQEVLAIAAGSPVELRLADNTKMRGRLGAISDTDFEFQTLKHGKLETQRIRFDNLKSIRDTSRSSFGRSLGKGFAIAGIVVGIITAVAVISIVANSN